MDDVIEAVRDPHEEAWAKQLENWFVAEDAFAEYVEQVEEEGAYPDLYGKSLVASPSQYPQVNSIVEEIATALDIEPPPVFLYESYNYVADSEGLRRPRLEVSARLARDFEENELRHVIAKEMYHIKAGHLRNEVMAEKILGVLNAVPQLPGVNMLKQYGGDVAFEGITFHFRSVAFNWFKYACYSADNFAVGYTGDVRSSIRATLLSILNERQLVSEVDVAVYVRQIARIESCLGPIATLGKVDEVIPYGPYRILNMLRFITSCRGLSFGGKYHRGAGGLA